MQEYAAGGVTPAAAQAVTVPVALDAPFAIRRSAAASRGARSRAKRNTERAMPKSVETYRTTKELRVLVRRAAKIEGKRPSEFLRLPAEERARAVIAGAAREHLSTLLAKLAPGRAASDDEAEGGAVEAARAARAHR
jgi:hypothetical protein